MRRCIWLVSTLGLLLAACGTTTPAPALTQRPEPVEGTAQEPTLAPPTATQPAATNTRLPATDTPLPATDTPLPEAEAPSPTAPAPTDTPATVFVTFQDFEIVPRNITIKAGTTVVFLIKGGPHQVVTDDWQNPGPNGFESPALNDGQSYTFTFNTPGNVPYFCGFHGNKGGVGMAGTIVVEP